jgi:phage/plasmid-like protein (TIGR03299 family)
MAHGIQNNNYFLTRHAAWHRLGIVKGSHLNRADIDKPEHLGWTAEKRQLEYNGNKVKAWGVFNTHTDQFICQASETIALHPHSIVFDTIDALIGASETDSCYETAGALGVGEVVWASADLKKCINVRDDQQKALLMGITSYNGKYETDFRTCLERPVCANTIAVALREKTRSKFKVKHTRNSVERLTEATEALKLWGGDIRSIEERMNFLADRTFTMENMKGLLSHLFPEGENESTRRQGIIDQIVENFERNDGDVFKWARGTCYAGVNAITEYADHQRGTRCKPGVAENAARAESAIFGSGNDLKRKATQIIQEYSTKAPLANNARPIYVATTYIEQTPIDTPVLDSILAGV